MFKGITLSPRSHFCQWRQAMQVLTSCSHLHCYVSQNLDALMPRLFTKYEILEYQGNFSKSVATRLGPSRGNLTPTQSPHHTEMCFGHERRVERVPCSILNDVHLPESEV